MFKSRNNEFSSHYNEFNSRQNEFSMLIQEKKRKRPNNALAYICNLYDLVDIIRKGYQDYTMVI